MTESNFALRTLLRGHGAWAYRLVVWEEGPLGQQVILAEDAGPLTQSSNNRAEMTAAIRGLEAGLALGFGQARLYTDCAYLANCFSERWYLKWLRTGWLNGFKKPIDNRDLWVKISWEHVRGHSGLKHNEGSDDACVRVSLRAPWLPRAVVPALNRRGL